MKQTNNALTFLMAQYRAIFKNAYFKGIASAVVLTAGLAAAQGAQAAGASPAPAWDQYGIDETTANNISKDGDKTNWSTAGDATVSSDEDFGDKLYFNNITVNGGTLTNNNKDVRVSGSLTVNGGTLKLTQSQIAGFGKIGETENDGGLKIGDDYDNGTGDLINNARVEIIAGGGNGWIQMRTVTLKSGSTTTITGKSGAGKIDASSFISAGFGSDSDGFILDNGAILNLKDNSHICAATGSNIEISGTVNLTAAADNSFAGFRASDNYFYGNGNPEFNTETTSAEVNINSGATLNVKSGDGYAVIFAAKTNFKGGDVKVANGGRLALDGDILKKDKAIVSTGDFSSDNNSAGVFNLTAGSIDIASGGTLTIGAGKFAADATGITEDQKKQVTTLNVNGGTLTNAGTLDIRGAVNFAQDQAFTKGIIKLASGANPGEGGQIVVSKGTLDIGGTTVLSSGNSSGSVIDVQDKLNIVGNTLKTYLNNSGSTIAENGASITVSGTLELGANAKLADVSEAHAEAPNTPVAHTLVLASGGTLNMAGGATLKVSQTDATVGTGATLALAAGATLDFSGNGSKLVVDSGSLSLAQGSKVNLNGTLEVTNAEVDLTGSQVSGSTSGTLTAGKSGSISFNTISGSKLKAENGGTLKGNSLTVAVTEIRSGGNVDIGAESSLEIGTLNLTGSGAAAYASTSGTIVVTQSIANKDGAIKFNAGTLQLGATDGSTASGSIGSDLVVNSGNTTNVLGTWAADGKKVEVTGANATLNVGSADTIGTLTAEQIAVSGGTLNINSGSTFTVAGKDTSADSTIKAGDNGYYGFGLSGTEVQVKGGTFVIGDTAAKGLLNSAFVAGSTEAGKDYYAYGNFGTYNLLTGDGTLKINFASGTSFTADQFTQLKKDLLTLGTVDTSGEILHGTLDLTGVTVEGIADEIINEDESGNKTTDYQDFVNNQGVLGGSALDDFKEVQLTDVDGPVNGANVGSLALATGTDEATISGGTTNLYTGDANGNLISNASGDAAGATIGQSANLTLQGDGEVGAITLTEGTDKTATQFAANNENTIASVTATTTEGALLANTSFAVGSTDEDADPAKVTVTGAADTDSVAVSTLANNNGSELTVTAGNVKTNALTNNGTLAVDTGSITTDSLNSAAGSSITTQTIAINNAAGSVIAGDIAVSSDDKEKAGFVLKVEPEKDSVKYATVNGDIDAAGTKAEIAYANIGASGSLTADTAELTSSDIAGDVTIKKTNTADDDSVGFKLTSNRADADDASKIATVKVDASVNAAGTNAELTNADIGASGSLTAQNATVKFSGITDADAGKAGTIAGNITAAGKLDLSSDLETASGDVVKASVTGALKADEASVKYADLNAGASLTASTAALKGSDLASGSKVTISAKATEADPYGFTMESGLKDGSGADANFIPAQLNGVVDAKDTGAKLTDVNVGASGSLTAASVLYANDINVAGTVTTANTIIGQADSAADANDGFLANVTFTSDNKLGNVTFADYTKDGVGSTLTIANADVTADLVTGAAGVVISVGSDGDGEDDLGATGSLEIATLNQNGAALVVDPAFGQKAAIVAIQNLTTKSDSGSTGGDTGSTGGDDSGAGTEGAGSEGSDAAKAVASLTRNVINGDILVGQNSVLGLGVSKAALLSALTEQYQDKDGIGLFDEKGSLNPDKYGAVLYLGKPVEISKDHGVIVTTATTAAIRDSMSLANNAYAVADTLYLDSNTALALNADNASKDDAYITFAADKGTIQAEGGDIVVFGEKLDMNFKIFDLDKDELKYGEGVEAIEVKSYNGWMTGTIDDSGAVRLDFDPNKVEGASGPVIDTLVAYIASDKQGNEVLNTVLWGGDDGEGAEASDIEKVARWGVYAGGIQAALTAGASTYEAVTNRFAGDIGVTAADNGQGGALWVSPIYKNLDADGFDANNLSYGTDLDLWGVALGADYKLANGVVLGAAFNVGSGDADGDGAADGFSNDFDYYGFSVYGGYQAGPLSIIGDISYTQVDNDVDTTWSWSSGDKDNDSYDTSNFSIGVTGSYEVALDNGCTVKPHAGIRYIKIDVDDLTFGDDGDVGQYSTDDLSIVSIPVGVSFAKEFNNGSWTVKPNVDFTLTFNAGDTDTDATMQWANTDVVTKTNTEVLDSVTYGAKVGVSAQNGAFGLGFGLGYTGSSNTDELSVNANARFVF